MLNTFSEVFCNFFRSDAVIQSLLLRLSFILVIIFSLYIRLYCDFNNSTL